MTKYKYIYVKIKKSIRIFYIHIPHKFKLTIKSENNLIKYWLNNETITDDNSFIKHFNIISKEKNIICSIYQIGYIHNCKLNVIDYLKGSKEGKKWAILNANNITENNNFFKILSYNILYGNFRIITIN